MKFASGHEIVDVTKEYQEEVARKMFHFEKDNITLNPGRLLFSGWAVNHLDDMYNFKVRDTDTFVAAYPRSGSTFTQEIVWAMRHNPNLDHPNSQLAAYQKVPIFETDSLFGLHEVPPFFCPPEQTGDESFLDSFDRMPDPRVFKTHIHFSMLKPESIEKAKLIYVMRNPMDTCISFYHFAKGMKMINYPDDIDTFVDDFVLGKMYGGQNIEHIKQWWQWREHKNVHTIFFEDLKRNTMDELRKLNTFLETDLTEAQLENVKQYTTFSEMKKRDMLEKPGADREEHVAENGFGLFRTGTVGSSVKELSPEMKSKLKEFYRKNLGDVKLPYSFDDE